MRFRSLSFHHRFASWGAGLRAVGLLAVLLAPCTALGTPTTYYMYKVAPVSFSPGAYLYIRGTFETDGTLGPIVRANVTAFDLDYVMSAEDPVCADGLPFEMTFDIAYPFPAGIAYFADWGSAILHATEDELYVDLSPTSAPGGIEIKSEFPDPWGGGHETYFGYSLNVWPAGTVGPDVALTETWLSEHLNNCSPVIQHAAPTRLLFATAHPVRVVHSPVPSPHRSSSLEVLAQISTWAPGASIDPTTVFLDYSVDEGPTSRVLMSDLGGSSFSASIPLQPNQQVTYRITADDTGGHRTSSPSEVGAVHTVYAPREVAVSSAYPTSDSALGVAVSADLAFVANASSGLSVIDVSDPASPSLVGSVGTPGTARNVAVAGGLAFIAEDEGALRVIDVSVPSTPSLIGSLQPAGAAFDVAVSGSRAFLSANHLQVIAIDDPSAPSLVATVETSGPARGIAVSAGHVFVAVENSGLDMIDASDLSGLAGNCDTPGTAFDVTVAGNFAFVADGAAGVQVIDVTNIYAPQIIASLDTPGTAVDVAVSGNLLFVADTTGGLQVIDVTDPSAPAYAWESVLPAPAQSVVAAGGRAFVAGLGAGLQVIDYAAWFSTLNPLYVDAVMASDPLFYWSFEETPLEPARDRVTQLGGNALVPQQGATRAESMPGLGSAASFAGTHDYAQTQPRFYASSLSLGGPTVFDHYAIEMWVKLNDASGIQYLLEATSPSSANAPAVIHGFSTDAGVPTLEYFGAGARTGEAGPTVLTDNQWHHLVMEAHVASNTHTIYVDGQLAIQAPGAVAWQLPTLGVGATAYWDGLHGVDGMIDELAFYDLSSGPTTGARIASHYYVMFAATSTPPASSSNTRPVLHASVPNPFNPSTTIRFDLPRAGRVELAIYDVAGRRVRTLVQEAMGAGSHEVIWRGVDENGRQVASGVYLYRLEAGSYVETRRMTLIK